MKKIISLLLAMSMMLSLSMTAFADDDTEEVNYDDEIMLIEEDAEDVEVVEEEEVVLTDEEKAFAELSGHWAEPFITYMNEKGVILPTSASFTPDAQIFRVEFMRYINRAFDFTDMTSISFNDVEAGSWYYDDVAKAVYQGYIEGTGSGNMNPAGYLTRQEAVVIMSRLHNVEASNTDNLNFTDADEIADWAAPYISFAVDAGYVSGRTDGSFDPLGYITRGEIAKIIYYFGGTLLENSWNEQNDLLDDVKNVSITDGNTYLENATVKGNLYITQGVGTGEVIIENVDVLGEIIVAGGTVTLSDVTADTLTIISPQNEPISIELLGDCQIIDTFVYSQADLIGDGFLNVIETMEFSDSDLYLEGEFRDVALSTDVNLTVVDTTMSTLYLSNSAKSAEITLKDSYISSGTFNSSCTVVGTDSTIYEIYFNATNIDIIADYKLYYLATGSSAVLNGSYLYGDDTKTVTTSEFYVNIGDSIGDITTAVSFDADDILRVTYNGTLLTEDEDYRLSSSIFTVYGEVFSGVTQDTYVTIVPATGDDIVINIYFIDLTQNAINSSSFTYDKYLDTTDLEITLTAASDKTVTGICYGGYYYLTDSEYSVVGNKIKISSTYLKTLSTGTASFEIKMSGLNNPKFVVTISNTITPNGITPGEFVFDTNIASTDYSDIVVLLSITEGIFEGIYNGTEALVENTDYVVNGDYITIRREYIVALGTTSTQTLEFKISLGVSPELEIDIESTNPVVAIFVDENGLPLEGVTATCQEKTAISDKNGKAYFNLDHGNKTIYYEKNGYESEYSTFYTSANITEKTYTLYLD
ncbi:MAG: X2-like carbohydrate binding domain-containing protein [Clostridia bacterium]